MSLQTRIKAAGAAAAAAPVDAGRRRAVKRRTKRAVMDRMGYDEVARISAYIDPALAARNCVPRWRRRSMLRNDRSRDDRTRDHHRRDFG